MSEGDDCGYEDYEDISMRSMAICNLPVQRAIACAENVGEVCHRTAHNVPSRSAYKLVNTISKHALVETANHQRRIRLED